MWRRLGLIVIGASTLALCGCQTSYLIKSGIEQAKLLSNRVPLETVLNDPRISEDTKSKIRLSQKARAFAREQLHLKETENYTSYVQLDRDYVTYALSAAPAFELKPYEWEFPIVGKVPYKGFFSLKEAEAESKSLSEQGLDTYIRGVSAYSTLGWFKDPLLSSMMQYTEYQLVNTIIHETVHATLFIKGAADFNERLATFLGNIGTERFYLALEGKESKSLLLIQNENSDDRVFSEFMSRELRALETFYSDPKNHSQQVREKYFAGLKERFQSDVTPKLKTKGYRSFVEGKVNNAVLVAFKTYFYDFSDFETVFESYDRDFKKFLEYCKSLEKQERPEEALKMKAQAFLRAKEIKGSHPLDRAGE